MVVLDHYSLPPFHTDDVPVFAHERVGSFDLELLTTNHSFLQHVNENSFCSASQGDNGLINLLKMIIPKATFTCIWRVASVNFGSCLGQYIKKFQKARS